MVGQLCLGRDLYRPLALRYLQKHLYSAHSWTVCWAWYGAGCCWNTSLRCDWRSALTQVFAVPWAAEAPGPFCSGVGNHSAHRLGRLVLLEQPAAHLWLACGNGTKCSVLDQARGDLVMPGTAAVLLSGRQCPAGDLQQQETWHLWCKILAGLHCWLHSVEVSHHVVASFCNKSGLAHCWSNAWIAGVGVKASLERTED